MLTIRFTRKGKKNQPFFRLVVCDKTNSAKAGKAIEILGNYNPLTKQSAFKKERIERWLKVGAQPSDSANNFLIKQGIIKGKKVAVHKKSKKKKGEEVKAEPPKTGALKTETPKTETPKTETTETPKTEEPKQE